ncbi:MAG TPA: hypothetical protein VL523_03490 [Terriglobia bacterium]|nr:hypothetical protein [Terriglobia bacterium]
MRLKRNVLSVTLAVLSGAVCLGAQEHHHTGATEAAPGGHLGQVSFSNSCAPAAEAPLNQGVALLHSFQYEASDLAFKRAAAQDPDCAIAYWGQAMTLWHGLWERPQAASLATGHDEVQKAESLKAKTAREREYIAAAAAFYQDDSKLEYAARAMAYSKAMGQVHQHYLEDGDAAAFYALSLIDLPAHGAADLANRENAIAILNTLFAAEPDHPGAAHYLIHACDTPELASQGLDAARRYAKIAPDSAHALHMPSHIFTRLGLWQESIASNIASAAAAAEATKMHLGDEHYQLHAMTFLEYAYLQIGQNAAAQQVIDDVTSVPGVTTGEIEHTQAAFRATYALETHDWKMAAALEPPSGAPGVQQMTWWARAIGAARSGDVAGARSDVDKLAGATAAAHAQSKKEGYDVSGEKSIDQLEAEAWLAWAEGRHDDGLATLRAAADREDREGVDSLTMPAREMLGDMLMESNQPAAAVTAYQTALKESPNRRDGVHGQELATRAAGQPAARSTPSGGSK